MNGTSQYVATQSMTGRIWTRDFTLIWLVQLLVFLGFQMTLSTLPLYIIELGGSNRIVGLIVGIFTITALIIRPWSGNALESRGRRLISMIGLAILGVSLGAFSLTINIFILFILRMMLGIGWGLTTTAAGTVATDIIPAHRRGEGLGYFGLSGNIGMAFGPALAVTLVVLVGFAKMYIFSAIFTTLALILASFIHYRPIEIVSKKKIKKRWDWYEKSALIPSLLFFVTISNGAVFSFLPLYAEMEGIHGIGTLFFFYGIAAMVSRPASGRIYDRIGHRAIFIPGAVLIICSMLLLTFLKSIWMLYTSAVLYGIGFGAVQPVLMAWANSNAPDNRKGMANATFFSSFDLGIGCGAILFGFLAECIEYSGVYCISAISVGISIILYLIVLKGKKNINDKHRSIYS